MKKTIHIYTDGSSKGNPGPGGYCVFLETFFKSYYTRKIISNGFRYTTNNRMELLAVITGLKHTNEHNNIIIFTDSKYIINPIIYNWVYKWKNENFYKKKNIDLWKKFLILLQSRIVKFFWIPSHKKNNYLNDFCDKVSIYSSQNHKLQIDYFYEKNISMSDIFSV